MLGCVGGDQALPGGGATDVSGADEQNVQIDSFAEGELAVMSVANEIYGLLQYFSTSSTVDSIFARLEAPKTIDSTLGNEVTHATASSGWIAPEAKTDIAMARNFRLFRASM